MKKLLRGFLITVLPVVALTATAHAQVSSRPGDCQSVRPPVEAPNTDPLAPDSGAIVQRDMLTNQLATCGSVLAPPPVGDPDVVQPAPAIDDPMAIHPANPALNGN